MKLPTSSDYPLIIHGDCVEVLKGLPDGCIDAVVTDPPYGLEFMGKEWDAPWKTSAVGRGVNVARERADEMTEAGKGHTTSAGPYLAARVDSTRIAGLPFQQWCHTWLVECYRVLKPGGHALIFGGTRTFHRMAVAVEDAGFEIRDSIAWLYGSGFPKSLNVSKAIDKAAGAERTEGAREWVGGQRSSGILGENHGTQRLTKFDAPATDAAKTWDGWGTALKPAFEPIVVARKPLTGTVAANVLAHGTGALNVDGCRVEGALGGDPNRFAKTSGGSFNAFTQSAPVVRAAGRWPANVVLDDYTAAIVDEQSGASASVRSNRNSGAVTWGTYGDTGDDQPRGYDDTGGASRFFYTAKAPGQERPSANGVAHPTVKPLDLMRWLVRLVTPPGGLVLEPFAGSGTTVEACIHEHMRCVAIEREADYLPLIDERINRNNLSLFAGGEA